MNHISLEKRKDKWKRFMKLDPDVKAMVCMNLIGEDSDRPMPNPEHREKRIDWAAEHYKRGINSLEWREDDFLPCLYICTGTETFAEAFGCSVHRTNDNMPFALPLINSADEVAKLKVPSLQSSTLYDIFEMTEQLIQRVGWNKKDGVPVKLPDIQSPIDIAALIWEKSEFFAAMYDEPEAVSDLSAMTEQLLNEFLDEWFRRYGTEYIAHYPMYLMDGGLTLSEDEVGAISPQMFEQFCLGSLNRLSDRYGGIGIHCCAHSSHQWHLFASVKNLKFANFACHPPELKRELYKILADICCQQHSWAGDGEPCEAWADNYPANAHIVYEGWVFNREHLSERTALYRKIEEARMRLR